MWFNRKRLDLRDAVERMSGFNDDTATNTTAIQELINRNRHTATAADAVIELPPGVVYINAIEDLATATASGVLNIPANSSFVLRGQGMSNTVLDFNAELTDNATQAFFDFKVMQGATLVLENMTVKGPEINQDGMATPFDGTGVAVSNWLVYTYGRGKVICRNVKFVGGNISFKTDYTYTPSYSAWAAGTLYYPGDRVTNGGNIYEVEYGGTSEAGYAPTGVGGVTIAGASAGYLSWVYVGTAASFSEPPILEFYNCHIGGRANFLGIVAAAAQTNANYDNAKAYLRFIDCTFEKDADSMYLGRDSTACGHNLYIDPGYNVYIRGGRIERTGGAGSSALHFTDSLGDGRINTQCVIDGLHLTPFARGIIASQSSCATLTNCTFNYRYTQLYAYGGSTYGSKLQVANCTFNNYQAGAAAISDYGTSSCDMDVVNSTFKASMAATGGAMGYVTSVVRNTINTGGNTLWRFTNCTFGGDSTKDDAVLLCASSATKDQHRNEFINCTFGAHAQYFTIRANSGHYLFRDVKVLGSKDLSFFDPDFYSNSNWAVQDIVVHCDRLDLSANTSANGGLSVVNPDTKTFTITGTIKWGSNAPEVGALSSIKGYLGFYQGVGANKASAASVTFDGNYDTYHVTGTTTIDNIYILSSAATRLFRGPLHLIADGAFAFSSSGNIVPLSTAARTAGEVTSFVYETEAGKWREISGSGGGAISVGAFGSTPTAYGAGISSDVLVLQPADGSNPGAISLSDQTLGAGVKTVAGLTSTARLTLPYTAKTTTYTITASDHTVDCTSGTFTVTLPTAVGCQGRIYVVKNSGAGTITLDADGSETIDGSASLSLAATNCYTVQSNGANWIIV